MERTRTEIALFTTAIAGIWLFGAGIILVNKYLAGFALLVILFVLACFALRNSE